MPKPPKKPRPKIQGTTGLPFNKPNTKREPAGPNPYLYTEDYKPYGYPGDPARIVYYGKRGGSAPRTGRPAGGYKEIPDASPRIDEHIRQQQRYARIQRRLYGVPSSEGAPTINNRLQLDAKGNAQFPGRPTIKYDAKGNMVVPPRAPSAKLKAQAKARTKANNAIKRGKVK